MATSKMKGTGSIKVNGVIEATIIGLNRKPKIDDEILGIALFIKERLDL